MSKRAADIRAEGAAAERKAVVAFARERSALAYGQERRGRLTIAEAKALNRRLSAFIDEIEQGMHLPECPGDSPKEGASQCD